MFGPHHITRSAKRGVSPRRLAAATLVTYLFVLLQPCAAAMAHQPGEHPDSCHQQSSQPDGAACLSQPALDCASDDLLLEGKDPRKPADDAFAVRLLPILQHHGAIVSVSERAYFVRAPPPDGAPLNIRHCVYLK